MTIEDTTNGEFTWGRMTAFPSTWEWKRFTLTKQHDTANRFSRDSTFDFAMDITGTHWASMAYGNATTAGFVLSDDFAVRENRVWQPSLTDETGFQHLMQSNMNHVSVASYVAGDTTKWFTTQFLDDVMLISRGDQTEADNSAYDLTVVDG